MTANMIGVRFRDASKIYHFAPPDEVIHEGEYVVVETARGTEMARVVTVPPEDAGPVPNDARPIVRLADGADRDRAEEMAARGERMLERTRMLVVELGLPMYVVVVQVNLAGSEATCFFQADGHVDFMPAIEAVEAEFSVRMHMQQAGPRDRAKLVDGHDICGLRLCCSSWMTDFPKVGIRMAKEQSLALNPDKISGVCGRLLCCLTFEFDVYREMRGTLPKVGKRVSTPAGMGRVVQANVLKQTITLELDDHAGRVEVPALEIGMAVRVEERPNAALEETLQDILPNARPSRSQESSERGAGEGRGRRRRGRGRGDDGSTPRASGSGASTPSAPTPTSPASGEGGTDEQPGRRRRRRRGAGTGRRESGGTEAESAGRDARPVRPRSDGGPDREAERAQGPASEAGAESGGAPKRRRRRRRRGGGSGEAASGGDSASGGASE